MFFADQNKRSLDFLLKAAAFATALLVPTLLELVYSDFPWKQHPWDKVHSSPCIPGGTTRNSMYLLQDPWHLLCSLLWTFYMYCPSITRQSFSKKKVPHSHRKNINSHLYLLSASDQIEEEYPPLQRFILSRGSMLPNILTLNWSNQPKICHFSIRKRQVK